MTSQPHDPAGDEPVTLLDRMGGVSGLVAGAVPTVAYVIANAIAGLDVAVVVAVSASVGLIVLRRVRGQSIQPAVSGLLGVVVAALIAFYTGSAEGYFLPGIWASLVMAVVCAVSILVRRPIVGVIWNALTSRGSARPWRSDGVTLRAFDVATLAFTAVFVARFVVQDWLYDALRCRSSRSTRRAYWCSALPFTHSVHGSVQSPFWSSRSGTPPVLRTSTTSPGWEKP